MSFYSNLPGVQPTLIDTPLIVDIKDNSPRVLVIGTATKGPNLQPIPLATTSLSKTIFGSSGTLTRGVFEVKAQGASNVVGMRIGGTSASLTGIGADTGQDGWSVTTDLFDDAAGDRYLVWYDASENRLAVYDAENEEWVYDSAGLLAPIPVGVSVVEPVVTPTLGNDVGTVSAPIAMSACDAVDNMVYTAGTDGTDGILTKLYERLYDAYQLLDFAEFDIIVPMLVHIDELNVADMDASEISDRALASLTDYPVEASAQDILGKLFVQEVAGTNYFWWDMDDDGVAEIFPSVGSASATTDAGGVTLTSADFHEVNFAHQLAAFCHQATERWQFVLGVISFKSPTGYSLSSMATWLGKLPTYTVDAVSGDEFINAAGDNGSGILGNKFLAGRDDWRAGAKDGGFIATDDGFLDGEELLDSEDNVIDIGKYLSIVAGGMIHINTFNPAGYISEIATSYAGMIATLVPQSAPTNKAVKALRLIKNIKASYLDSMAGVRIVTLVNKAKGLTVTDAPTAARPASNYRRLTTVRIVKDVVRIVREAADPFIGEPNSAPQQSALKTIINTALQAKVLDGSLRRFDFSVSATPQQRVLGQLVINMVLVPNFEVQTIPLTITLSAE